MKAILQEAHAARQSRRIALYEKPKSIVQSNAINATIETARSTLIAWECLFCHLTIPVELAALSECPRCDRPRHTNVALNSRKRARECDPLETTTRNLKTLSSGSGCGAASGISSEIKQTFKHKSESTMGWKCSNIRCRELVPASLHIVDKCPFCFSAQRRKLEMS